MIRRLSDKEGAAVGRRWGAGSIAVLAVVFAALWSVSPRPSLARQDAFRTDIIVLTAMPAARAIALYDKVIGVTNETRIAEGRTHGTVVVRDRVSRLERFRSLLGAFDTQGANKERLFLRPVRHILPHELATLLQVIIESWRKSAPGMAHIVMVPDDRGGQLIVRSTLQRYEALDRLIRRLDVPDEQRRRAIRVVPHAPPKVFLP